MRDTAPALRAQRYAAFLDQLADSGTRASLTSPGGLLGLGTVGTVTTDCGQCSEGGLPIRWRVKAATHQFVSADTFHMLGIRVRGRARPHPRRCVGRARVAVINRSLAAREFQDGEAIGRGIRVVDDGEQWSTVVGVVDDPPAVGLGAGTQPKYSVYLSVLQHPPESLELMTPGNREREVQAAASVARTAGHRRPREADARAGRPGSRAAALVRRHSSGCRDGRCSPSPLLGALAAARLWVTSLLAELGVRRAMGARRRHTMWLRAACAPPPSVVAGIAGGRLVRPGDLGHSRGSGARPRSVERRGGAPLRARSAGRRARRFAAAGLARLAHRAGVAAVRVMNRIFGAHTVDNGGIHMAALRAGRAGMKAAADLHRHPQVLRRQDLDPPRAGAALPRGARRQAASSRPTCWCTPPTCSTPRRRTRRNGGAPRPVCGRSWSAPPRSAWARSASTPAPPPTATASRRVERIALAITSALEAVPGETKILIENTAGAGMTMGKTPEEVGAMLEGVPAALRARTGYGLDTCHLFSAGHDITASAGELARILDAVRGGGRLAARRSSISTTARARSARTDRHVLIGDGRDRRRAVPLAAAGSAERGHTADPGDAAAELRDRRGRRLAGSVRREDDGAAAVAGGGNLRARRWTLPALKQRQQGPSALRSLRMTCLLGKLPPFDFWSPR